MSYKQNFKQIKNKKNAVAERRKISAAHVLVPLLVHDPEGHVFVRRARAEAQHGEVAVLHVGRQIEARGGLGVQEVGVEDVELVAHHDLGRRVLAVVVRAVVLVPVVAHLDAVEVERLSRAELLLRPTVGGAEGLLRRELGAGGGEDLFVGVEGGGGFAGGILFCVCIVVFFGLIIFEFFIGFTNLLLVLSLFENFSLHFCLFQKSIVFLMLLSIFKLY